MQRIRPLSAFLRRTLQFRDELRESGEPIVLTVNGRAELVVIAAEAYQRLVERAERAILAGIKPKGYDLAPAFGPPELVREEEEAE